MIKTNTLTQEVQHVCEHVNVMGFRFDANALKQMGHERKSFSCGDNGIIHHSSTSSVHHYSVIHSTIIKKHFIDFILFLFHSMFTILLTIKFISIHVKHRWRYIHLLLHYITLYFNTKFYCNFINFIIFIFILV